MGLVLGGVPTAVIGLHAAFSQRALPRCTRQRIAWQRLMVTFHWPRNDAYEHNGTHQHNNPNSDFTHRSNDYKRNGSGGIANKYVFTLSTVNGATEGTQLNCYFWNRAWCTRKICGDTAAAALPIDQQHLQYKIEISISIQQPMKFLKAATRISAIGPTTNKEIVCRTK